MTARFVAGVDCSTQATKVLVVDVDSGEVVASGRSSHVVSGTDGARESDPRRWWSALGQALASTQMSEQIQSISVAGQQHGLVTLDDQHNPLRPAMLWNDTRSAEDAERLCQALGGEEAWAERVGVVPVASFTVSKLAWLRRHEPAVAAKVAAVRLPHDYITECLTGHGVTDRGDVSGTGWWSTKTESYDPEVLGLKSVAIDVKALPRVLGPAEIAGEVTTVAAEELGLSAGTLTAAGSGDNMAAALGLGLEPGTPVVSLGTSGTAYAVSQGRIVDPTGTVAGFADATGLFLPLAATLNCTLAVDRVASWLGLDRDDIAVSTDCVVLPYLDGERTPNLPGAAGSIVGLRHDTDAPQILRAAYEGAVESLMTALGTIDDVGTPLSPEAPLVLIGGGARGTAWREVVGELSARALQIPDEKELVAIGAAVQAAAALDGSGLIDVARRWKTRQGETIPARTTNPDRIGRIREVREQLAPLNNG